MLPAGSTGSVWDVRGCRAVAMKGTMDFGEMPV